MPERTCVGCRACCGQDALIRVVFDGQFRVDADRRLPGRGAYVHAGCVELALKRKALQRGLRASGDAEQLASILRRAAEPAAGPDAT